MGEDGANAGLGAAGFESGQTLADVDGRAQLAIDAVDPRVHPADLGDQLAPHVTHLGGERIDLVIQLRVDVIDLFVDPADVGADGLQLTA